MSVWTDINLNDVATGFELLPKGTYTFSILPGAKYGDRDPNRIEFQLAVVGGDLSGRRVFPSFPNPTEFEWAPVTFARLIEAVGVDIEEGEDKVAYLNRIANLHVEYDVIHKTDTAGVERANVNLFKPRPAKA